MLPDGSVMHGRALAKIDHHDTPGTRLAHRRQGARRDHGRRDEVDVELLARLGGRHLLHRPELEVASVVDDGVEVGQLGPASHDRLTGRRGVVRPPRHPRRPSPLRCCTPPDVAVGSYRDTRRAGADVVTSLVVLDAAIA
jgi:hypothetical protein